MFTKTLNRIFRYPLPLRENTQYDKLGLSPEATSLEIREAKAEQVNRIKKQQTLIQKQLSGIYNQVDGLRAAEERLHALKCKGSEVNSGEMAEAQTRLGQLEAKAMALNPQYRSLLAQLAELEKSIFEINRIILENPNERLNYDKAVAPLAQIKLESCDEEIFTERGRKLLLYCLRQEIIAFLGKRGEVCFHPTDFTRSDFVDDFSANQLLDGDGQHDRTTRLVK